MAACVILYASLVLVGDRPPKKSTEVHKHVRKYHPLLTHRNSGGNHGSFCVAVVTDLLSKLQVNGGGHISAEHRVRFARDCSGLGRQMGA